MKKMLSICITLWLFIVLASTVYADSNRNIVFNLDEYIVYLGKQQKITAKVERISDDAPNWTKLVWSSSDDRIAKVDNNGYITGVNAGTVTIQAQAQDDMSIVQSTVVQIRVPVSKLTVSTKSAQLLVGSDEASSHIKLECTVAPSEAFHKDVIWTSSNEKVAVVDENGYVTAISKGAATITAKTTDPTQNWISSSCQVTVGQSVTDIELNYEAINVAITQTINLTAKVAPSNATNQQVIWSSSDDEIATVSQYGAVKGIKPGNVIITATAKDGSEISSSCSVNVVSPVKKITLNEKSISMPVNESLHLIATIEPEDATIQDVIWASSNESIATVDEYGVIKTIANGRVNITATAADGSKANATVSVTVEDYDVVFRTKQSQDVQYYYGSGRFTVTCSNKTGACSVPNMHAQIAAMVVGGMASDDVTVTPVRPGADVVTIKVNSTNYTYKVYVSEQAFPELIPQAQSSEDKPRSEFVGRGSHDEPYIYVEDMPLEYGKYYLLEDELYLWIDKWIIQ